MRSPTGRCGGGPPWSSPTTKHTGVSRWQLADLDLRWHCAGALLATRLGDDYAVIGSAIGTALHQGITEPDPETIEGRLYALLPPGAHLLPADALTTATHDTQSHPEPRPAVSVNHGYFPLDPAAPRAFDAILFLRDVLDVGDVFLLSPEPA